MKERPPRRETEQVHNEPASAQDTQAYTLEEIMREFGGWSDWSEKDTGLGAPPAPAAEQENAAAAQTACEIAADAPDVQQPSPEGEAAQETPDAASAAEAAVPSGAPDAGDTIRFTPVQQEQPVPEPPKIWTYKGEPTPEPEEPEEKAAAQRQRRRREREEKKSARPPRREKKRRIEQPERVFASPEAAYQAYCGKGSLRLRTLLSLVLTLASAVLLALCNYTVVGVDFSGKTRLVTVLLLALMLVQAVLSHEVFTLGLRRAIQLRFDHLSLLALLTVCCTVDTLFAIGEGRIPFCPVVSLALLLALWAELMHVSAKRRSMKAVCAMSSPVAAVREEKAWHGKDCIFRTAGDKEAFMLQLELPDATRRIMRVYAPVIAIGTLLLAVLTALRGNGGFFWAWTAMLAAGYPMGMLIAYPRPFHICAKRLLRHGAAVAGWQGAKNLGGECELIITDADLFPPDNVTLNGMKIYSDRNVTQIVGYAAAVVETAGSGLVPLFREIQASQNGRHYSVETFRRYEGGGLGAEMQGDVVLMGSLAFMKLMRVRMPEGAGLKQAVYLAINSELAAVFALHYTADPAAQSSLHAATRSGALIPMLATRDFMITPQFLKHRYKLAPEKIEFPTVEERARLSSSEAVRDPRQGAMMARGSFTGFVATVTGARTLRSAARGAAGVAILGGVIGALVLFFLTFIGSVQAVSAWNLLIFALLWLLPELLLTGLNGS